jgi:hypothetical protein
MGPGNPPSHPDLLALLAQRFRDSGYDLKRLMRWMANSEAFSLSSKIAEGGADHPEAGLTPLFSRYYTRQMEPEQVYESLAVLCGEPERPVAVDERERAKSEWLSQFTMRLDTDEGEETVLFNGAVPQALMMMNGPLVRRATSLEQDSVLRRVVQSRVTPAEKVEQLYLAALTRRPTRRELDAARQFVAASGDVAIALQDLWWALLNSNEFILDH